MTDSNVIPAGSTAHDEFTLDITPEKAGWRFSGLKVVELASNQTVKLTTEEDELAIISLHGAATVRVDGETFHLQGRASVFAGPSDVVYVPRDSGVSLESDKGGRFALCAARAERRLSALHIPAADVPVEFRGTGQASRQVHNFGVPGVLDADALIACEVLTPSGNWSSWPPHKHDEANENESELEEIYYFEVAEGPHGPGIGFQRVYGHRDADIDITVEVRSGDTVLVPHGWHGPSIATPGYDLYYLNVMAGPAERVWKICDDPAHAWVRGTWTDQEIDPRLPFGNYAAVADVDSNTPSGGHP